MSERRCDDPCGIGCRCILRSTNPEPTCSACQIRERAAARVMEVPAETRSERVRREVLAMLPATARMVAERRGSAPEVARKMLRRMEAEGLVDVAGEVDPTEHPGRRATVWRRAGADEAAA